MASISVSVAQFAASTDKAANLTAAVGLITTAAPQSDIVVLPENAMYSSPGPSDDLSYAESLDGAFVTGLKNTAQSNNVAVLAGFTEDNSPKPPYNTLVFINSDGELTSVYRKIHLYDAFGYKESDKVTAADIKDPFVVDYKGVKIGAATCYDLRFPEISRWLVDAGADVVLLPAAWAVGPAKEAHWETLIRARAIENTIYFAACGQTGPHCAGQSMIVDPMGTILASAGEAGGSIATAVVDTNRVQEVRKSNPSLTNRRFSVAPIGHNG